MPIEYLILGIRKFTNGYVFTLGRAAIYGNPLKKTYIIRFMMESKFIALNKDG
jgi:hypothetical protein